MGKSPKQMGKDIFWANRRIQIVEDYRLKQSSFSEEGDADLRGLTEETSIGSELDT